MSQSKDAMPHGGFSAALRPDSPEPLYQQVKQYVLASIRAHSFGDERRLPSEAYLVEHLNVSRMTVHRALRELKNEGIVVRIPGRGTFVSVEKRLSTLLETQDIAEEIRSRGSVYSCAIEILEEVAADDEIATALDLKRGDPVFHSAILHEENGDPVQFEERWVKPMIAPGYLQQDFTKCTPHQFLVMSARITEVEHVLHAVRADARIQRYLRISADEPCLLLARRTWSGAVTATRSLFIYPGHRYSLGGRYKLIGEAERPVLGSMLTRQIYAGPAAQSAVAKPARKKRRP